MNSKQIGQASAPLVVSKKNPRYFATEDDAGHERLVYLTGSHIWNNFHDGLGPGTAAPEKPEVNDYAAYLRFLKAHHHNFIRLWRWEQFQSQSGASNFHLNMSPQPWQRTGPGKAKDGKPKFDLDAFDEAYFARLRARVIEAGKLEIYVDVMLFDGWGLHLSSAPDSVEGHPLHAKNNVNRIGIDSILDHQVLPLDSKVQALQEAYLKKVIDTLHDLPNVLYEVSNESSGGGSVDPEFAKFIGLSEAPDWGDSTQWQYWVIDFVKRYEHDQHYPKHPIGMTMQFPVKDQTKVNDPLLNSAAEWISPGYDDEIFAHGGHPMAPGSPPSHWYDNPPVANGRKIVISDTDHYAPGQGDALWAWKSFLRGHQPILMDFGIIDVAHPLDPSTGVPPYDFYEPARLAMGDTLRYAERMQLIEMQPLNALSLTEFVLAWPGHEYLVLQPADASKPFTVTLEAGNYSVEWFSVNERQSQMGGELTARSSGAVEFRSPFANSPAVLYLKRA